MNLVCVDAGLVIKLLTNEEDSHVAELLFSEWKQAGTKMIAPSFQYAEIDSGLRNKVRKKQISNEDAYEAFQLACKLPIELDNASSYRRRAWEIAEKFGVANRLRCYLSCPS